MADGPVEIAEVMPDSLEEVLQHISEQALRVAHVDDAVTELKQSVSDLSEAMQAGFVEIRTVATQQSDATVPAPAASGNDDLWRQSLTERLDEIERRAGAAGGRSSLLVLLVLLQTAALAVMLLMALGIVHLGAKPPEPPPQPVVAPAPPVPVTPPPAAAAPAVPEKPAPPAKGKHAPPSTKKK